ncbi:MAG: TonB family protein [Bacteroidetes bacterium]|nr:TonB family protein [Bacteroidota bacterium]
MKRPRPQRLYLDLVFEGRNKAYGAYQLRQAKDGYTVMGWAAAVLLVFTLLSVPLVLYNVQQRRLAQAPVVQERIVTFSQLSAPPPIEQVALPPEVPRTTQASKAYKAPVVKPDKEVPDEVSMPTVEELSFQQPGPVSAPGDSFVWLEPPPPEPKAKPEPPAPKPPEKPPVFQIVEEMPEFSGGEAAMYAYLRENMVYPTVARENGITGKVFVRFTVLATGRVTDVRVVRGIGGGCDEEAVRVIRSMPPWKPGIQSGRQVAVEFTLPINFVMAK